MRNIAVLFSLLLAATPAFAGDAVSAINGKVSLNGGSIDGKHTENLLGSVSAPITKNIGIQIDGLYGQVSEDDANGIGAHLFWRDSDIGLVGATAATFKVGDQSATQYGVAGEYYFHDFSVKAGLGLIEDDLDGEYMAITGVYYPLDDLALSAALSKTDTEDRWGASAEYQTPLKGLALYATALNGNKSFDAVVAGVRYYIGADKSLKLRHREDDPDNLLFSAVTSAPAAACVPNNSAAPGSSPVTTRSDGPPPKQLDSCGNEMKMDDVSWLRSS